jgi:hypothetical protein
MPERCHRHINQFAGGVDLSSNLLIRGKFKLPFAEYSFLYTNHMGVSR